MPDSFLDQIRPMLGIHPRRQAMGGGFVDTPDAPQGGISVSDPLGTGYHFNENAPVAPATPVDDATAKFNAVTSMPNGAGLYDAAKAAGFQTVDNGGDINLPNAGQYTPEEQSFIRQGAKQDLANKRPSFIQYNGQSFIMPPSVHVKPTQAAGYISAGRQNKADIQSLQDRSDALDLMHEQQGLANLQGEMALNDKSYQIDKGLQALQEQRRVADRADVLNQSNDALTLAQNKAALARIEQQAGQTPGNAFAQSFLKTANLADPRQAELASTLAPYDPDFRGLPSDLQQKVVSTLGPAPGTVAQNLSDVAGKIMQRPEVSQPISEVIQQLKTVGANEQNIPTLQAKIQQAIQNAVKFGADPEAIKQQIHMALRAQFPDAFTQPTEVNRFLTSVAPMTGLLGVGVNYLAGRGEAARQRLASFLDAQ